MRGSNKFSPYRREHEQERGEAYFATTFFYRRIRVPASNFAFEESSDPSKLVR
jgi:hypothetical protein